MSELPDRWLDVPLSEVTDINPPHPDRPIENDQLVSFVPMALVTEESGTLDASQLRPWREVSKGYTRFQEGDVLFAKITPCMENGKYALASGLNGGVGAGSTEFHVLRPCTGIRSEYLLNFLFQSDVRRGAKMEMKGAAGQLRVPTSFLERLRFPLAPPEEQDRIVAEIEKQFTRLDAATTALKRVQANLKRYRASVLKAACEGRLVPTEAELARKEGRDYEPADKLLERILRERRARWEADTLAKMIAAGKPPKDDAWKRKYNEPSRPHTADLPTLPAGWCWASLGQLTEIQGGIQKQPSRLPVKHSFPFLRVANVLRGRLDLSEVHKIEVFEGELERLRLASGDLLVVEGNGSPSEIGRMAVWSGEIENCVHQNHLIRCRPVNGVSGRFLMNFWNSNRGASQVLAVSGSTSGLHTLSVGKIARLAVPLPPHDEQHRIADAADAALSLFRRMESQTSVQASRASSLRQAILAFAFAGKLVSQDPKDESAAFLLERIRAERASAANGKPSKRSKKEPAYA